MESKKQAKQLKTFAKEFGYDIKLTHAQEIIAKMSGFRNRHAMFSNETSNKEERIFYYEIHVFAGRKDSYSKFFESKEKFDFEGDIVYHAIHNGILDKEDYDYVDYSQEIDKEEYERATGKIAPVIQIIPVTFVSEWEWTEDGTGSIITDATLNLHNGELSIESSDMNCDGIIKEYIIVQGKKFDVEEEDGEWKVSRKTILAIKTLVGNKS